jgi:putative sterol carrier protein
MNPLQQSLAGFLRAYEDHPALVAEQRGWSPVIALAATDTDARATVSLDDGRVAPERAAPPTLQISGTLQVLCDVLDRRLDPNEPYLFGELVVRGAEADFVRLDYVASRLCRS